MLCFLKPSSTSLVAMMVVDFFVGIWTAHLILSREGLWRYSRQFYSSDYRRFFRGIVQRTDDGRSVIAILHDLGDVISWHCAHPRDCGLQIRRRWRVVVDFECCCCYCEWGFVETSRGVKSAVTCKHDSTPVVAQYSLPSIEIGDRFVKISNTLSNTKLG